MDVLRAYPGGIAQLARDAKVPLHTLYRVAHATHRFAPYNTLRVVALAFHGKTVQGELYDETRLVKLWSDERASRRAS